MRCPPAVVVPVTDPETVGRRSPGVGAVDGETVCAAARGARSATPHAQSASVVAVRRNRPDRRLTEAILAGTVAVRNVTPVTRRRWPTIGGGTMMSGETARYQIQDRVREAGAASVR